MRKGVVLVIIGLFIGASVCPIISGYDNFPDPPDNDPLIAWIEYTPADPKVDESITFTAMVTGGTSPYNYSWNFGDGSSGSDKIVNHSYYKVDSYLVTLIVIDDDGSIATSIAIIKVNSKVKGEDIYGAESDWETLTVYMPKNKATEYSILGWFFEKLIKRFPFMVKILNQNHPVL